MHSLNIHHVTIVCSDGGHVDLAGETMKQVKIIFAVITASIFTNISHCVEALLQLLIRTFTKRCSFCFEIP